MSRPPARTRQARTALVKGIQAAGQVRDVAGEALRVRRDPSRVAVRRHAAAKRRTVAWSLVSLGAAAGGALQVYWMVTDAVTAGAVIWTVFALAVLLWSVPQVTLGLKDVRYRRKLIDTLPPPQPDRPAVPPMVRRQIQRLGALSDGLRQLVGMIGLVDDDAVLALRREVIADADAAELRLRRRAQELAGLLRARDVSAGQGRAGLDDTVRMIVEEIDRGVAEYGELVTAATDTVAAGEQLRVQPEALEHTTDRLRSLATGMRAISGAGPV
ncbi:hypothetical protein GIS00_21715 [Nakamurella sp. YIM 132087]|uniref:Uncharacterized protein n=1 Tax=Nakamurella alba TaxID=2665158 RepID=A0A7K1FT43_9ACTN|nr:hypothetical protein [Nakamurella alba]MTD16559.1 hypothetical protein [Nakamurella alba]